MSPHQHRHSGSFGDVRVFRGETKTADSSSLGSAAIARGEGATACTIQSNNRATIRGDDSTAYAGGDWDERSDDNTAIVNGENLTASATGGSQTVIVPDGN